MLKGVSSKRHIKTFFDKPYYSETNAKSSPSLDWSIRSVLLLGHENAVLMAPAVGFGAALRCAEDIHQRAAVERIFTHGAICRDADLGQIAAVPESPGTDGSAVRGDLHDRGRNPLESVGLNERDTVGDEEVRCTEGVDYLRLHGLAVKSLAVHDRAGFIIP